MRVSGAGTRVEGETSRLRTGTMTTAAAVVTTDTRHAHRVLSAVVRLVESHGAVELTDYTIEVG